MDITISLPSFTLTNFHWLIPVFLTVVILWWNRNWVKPPKSSYRGNSTLVAVLEIGFIGAESLFKGMWVLIQILLLWKFYLLIVLWAL